MVKNGEGIKKHKSVVTEQSRVLFYAKYSTENVVNNIAITMHGVR